MQNVSAEYKESMKSSMRNRGYMKVGIGTFDDDIYQNAVTDPDYIENITSDLVYFSDANVLFGNTHEDRTYATLEHNHSKVSGDGSVLFPPKPNSGLPYIVKEAVGDYFTANNGAVVGFYLYTNHLKFDDVVIRFGHTGGCNLNIYGVENENETLLATESILLPYTYNSKVSISMNFDNDDYSVYKIELREGTGLSFEVRLRVKSISLGGDGIFFTDEDIFTANIDDIMELRKGNTQKVNFSLTIPKYEKYNPENPNGEHDYWQKNTKIKHYIGYQLSNSIEWIEGYTTFLETVEADETQMTISSVDIVSSLEKMYADAEDFASYNYDDKFQDVAESYGVDYLWSKTSGQLYQTGVSPVPSVSGSDALKMIAFCSRSYLRILRSNTVEVIDADDFPEYNFEIEKTDMLSYPIFSIISAAQNIKVEYAKYTKSSAKQTVFEDTVRIPSDGTPVTISWENALTYNDGFAWDYSPKQTYYTLSIVDHTSKSITVSMTNTSVSPPDYYLIGITVQAYVAESDNYAVNVSVGQTGESVNIEVPLVNTAEGAEYFGSWIKNIEYQNLTVYEYDTRGNPEIDTGDIIYQENQYQDNMKVRVIENRIDYDGTFSGYMKVVKVEE